MRPENITRVSDRRGERGNVLAYTVISAFFLFLAVGLGVDLSHLYLAKTELQNAADAAALAGASALKDAIPERATNADDRATRILNANKYNFNNRTFTAAPVIEYAKNLEPSQTNVYKTSGAMSPTETAQARFIRVTTPSVPINTFFAIPILGFSTGLTATATAGLSVPGNVNACPTPLSAMACNTAITGSTCNLCDPSDPLYPNCTSSKYWGVCPGTNPNAPQTVVRNGPDDPDGDGLCDPKREFCKGCTYNIRAGAQNGQGPAPGAFLALACAGPGANNVRNSLAGLNDCPCEVGVQTTVETQTGELAGAIRQGLNVRFDQYGAGGLQYSTDIPPDTNIAQGNSSGQGANQVWEGISWGQYQGTATPPVTPVPPTHPGVINRRVLVVPLVTMDSVIDEGGHQTVRTRGLAGFFMRAQVSDGNGGDIQVEYISDDIVGVIGFNPNGPNATNIVTPVLYR
jgi:Flp pilus assembly protein TadG